MNLGAAIMEQSPLELYETAYKLHYVENRIADALLHYQKIIEVFPDSNECGYASIQIQKIKAENLAHELKKAGKILHPVSMIALIIGALSLLLSSTFGIILNAKVTIESKRSTLTLKALSKMQSGDDEGALKILTELKYLSSKNILPFELSADILCKQNKYAAAREEYLLFYKLNPGYLPTESEKKAVQKIDDLKSGDKKKILSKKPDDVSFDETSKSVIPEYAKKNASERVTENIKQQLIVKPDSISYF
jgi:tetratricopeptide (TPR) repeat protein